MTQKHKGASVPSPATEAWLALVIGNTRLHWGAFRGDQLVSSWHTPHLARDWVARIQASEFDQAVWQRVPGLAHSEDAGDLSTMMRPSSLWLASVVPEQTALWANRRGSDRTTDGEKTQPVPTYLVERSQIPLQNVYPTLGLDRAINLLGAGHTLGWPVLVVDAGTALTFTAGEHQAVVGGAILPGVRSQAQALNQKTAELPLEDTLLSCLDLPERWAMTTTEAIASGLIYSAIATLEDYLIAWWQQFPVGKAVLTGGDAPTLHALLQQKTPEIASRVKVDSNLMFRGMQVYRSGAMLLL